MCDVFTHLIDHFSFLIGILGMSILGGFASIYFTNGVETKLIGKALFLRINVSLFLGGMAALLAMDFELSQLKIMLSAGGASFTAVDILPTFSRLVIEKFNRFVNRSLL
jgi:hypothetical protein